MLFNILKNVFGCSIFILCIYFLLYIHCYNNMCLNSLCVHYILSEFEHIYHGKNGPPPNKQGLVALNT
jgi:hypothetical protein